MDEIKPLYSPRWNLDKAIHAFLFKNAGNRDLDIFSILFLTVAWFQAISD